MKITLYKKILRQTNFIGHSEGFSMMPLIKQGADIYVLQTKFNSLRINEIIVFWKNEKLVAHRIIYKNNRYLITKGDNSPVSDGKVAPRQIVGRVYKINDKPLVTGWKTYTLPIWDVLLKEISVLGEELDKNDIDYVVLEGFPLNLYYRNRDWHAQNNKFTCQILINSTDDKKAEEVLAGLTYQVLGKYSSLEYICYSKELNAISFHLLLRNNTSFLQLHSLKLEYLCPHELTNHFLWKLLKERKKIKIKSFSLYILSPAYLIVYLAIQIVRHNLRGVQRYILLDKVIQKTLKVNKNNEVMRLKEILEGFRLSTFLTPVFIILHRYFKTSFSNALIKSEPGSYMKNINIFNDSFPLRGEIDQLILLFHLSPYKWKRWFTLITPEVLAEPLKIIWKKITR